MPWGKNKSYSFSESSSKEKKTQTKEHLTQKNLTAIAAPTVQSRKARVKKQKLENYLEFCRVYLPEEPPKTIKDDQRHTTKLG